MNHVAIVLADPDGESDFPYMVMVVEAIINRVPVKKWAVKTRVDPVDEEHEEAMMDDPDLFLKAHIADALYQIEEFNEQVMAKGFDSIWPVGSESSCYMLHFGDVSNIHEL